MRESLYVTHLDFHIWNPSRFSSIHSCIHLFIHLSILPSIHPSIYLSYLSNHPSLEYGDLPAKACGQAGKSCIACNPGRCGHSRAGQGPGHFRQMRALWAGTGPSRGWGLQPCRSAQRLPDCRAPRNSRAAHPTWVLTVLNLFLP